MKKLLLLLLISPFFFACSSDEESEPKQEYTSFVVTIDDHQTFPNCVAGHKKDGLFYKLGDLGDLTRGKFSPEIRVEDKSITEIYIFSDFLNTVRVDESYTIKNNIKNVINIKQGTGGVKVTDKTDPTQYPQ